MKKLTASEGIIELSENYVYNQIIASKISSKIMTQTKKIKRRNSIQTIKGFFTRKNSKATMKRKPLKSDFRSKSSLKSIEFWELDS
jgi:hypothetical protein